MNPDRTLSRRHLLGMSLAAGASLPLRPSAFAADKFRIAPFRYDVTPPTGHPLCGGWITPVKSVDDPLEAIGFVILGAGDPIVICALDWTGLLNEAHLQWRTALAEAAGTTPDRVAVQCVHQHDAPFVCLASEKLIAEQDAGMQIVDLAFFRDCLNRGKAAVKEALLEARPLTHVAAAEAKVDRIAGNRRIALGPDGKVLKMRGSACKDPELIAMTEGLIDPQLKTVAFYSGKEKIASCHYYACHPMSHYGKGAVSSDYPGLARKRIEAAEPGCTHLYFTGCAGNIGAGKYNDGSPEARIELTDRLHAAMVAASAKLAPVPLAKVGWATHDLLPEVNPAFTEEGELEGLDGAAVEDPLQGWPQAGPVAVRGDADQVVALDEHCAPLARGVSLEGHRVRRVRARDDRHEGGAPDRACRHHTAPVREVVRHGSPSRRPLWITITPRRGRA